MGAHFGPDSYSGGGIVIAADFTGADLRGATNWSPVASTITRNTILPDGSIKGLALQPGEKLVVRNNPTPVTVTSGATIDLAATLQFLLEPNWTSPVGTGGKVCAADGEAIIQIASAVAACAAARRRPQYVFIGPITAPVRIANFVLPGRVFSPMRVRCVPSMR